MSEYRPGKNCKCNAWAAFECTCDNVDWRSKREVELEAENKRLREELKAVKETCIANLYAKERIWRKE